MKQNLATNARPLALRFNKETLRLLSVRTGVRTGDVACPPITHTCPTTRNLPSGQCIVKA